VPLVSGAPGPCRGVAAWSSWTWSRAGPPPALDGGASVEQLLALPPIESRIDLPHLSRLAQAMVRDGLDSFVQRDAQLARAVCARDDEVDDLYKQTFRELLAAMTAEPRTVGPALHLLLIARNIERIAITRPTSARTSSATSRARTSAIRSPEPPRDVVLGLLLDRVDEQPFGLAVLDQLA
jgi:hypothetical protein